MLLPAPALAQAAASAGRIDLAPIVQPILAVIGTVIASLLAIYVPRHRRAAGARQNPVDRPAARDGARRRANRRRNDRDAPGSGGDARVARRCRQSGDPRRSRRRDNAVPLAAAALNMTVDGVARMIVGAIDTGAHGAAPAADKSQAV